MLCFYFDIEEIDGAICWFVSQDVEMNGSLENWGCVIRKPHSAPPNDVAKLQGPRGSFFYL